MNWYCFFTIGFVCNWSFL